MSNSGSTANRRLATRWWAAAVALSLALLACSSLGDLLGRVDPVTQGPWTAEIGPDGGSLMTAAGDLTLEIPAGALTESTRIQADIADLQDPADLVGFKLTPDGLTFQRPVTIRFHYGGLLPEVSEPSSLVLIHATEQDEEPVAQQVLDSENQQISGTIEHFSWIYLRLFEEEDASMQLSGVDRLELQDGEFSAHYEVFLAYAPNQDAWELIVTVGHEAEGGAYQLLAEGDLTIENQAGLTEGNLPLSGQCQFVIGGSSSITGFEQIGVPFEILSSGNPQAGETATVVMNRESLPLYAVDTEDESSCPVFGPRQNFEILLSESIAPAPLDPE